VRVNRQYRAVQQEGRSRTWLIAIPTVVLLLLAAGWCGFWYISAGKAQASLDEWRSREANAGRVYRCEEESFGGFPFRIEMDCRNPMMEDGATQLTLRAGDLKAVAQVWDPTLLIGEISGPMTFGPTGAAPTMTMKWSLAQASLRGLPVSSQRLSIVIDQPGLTSSDATALASADHLEFHARRAPTSTAEDPALDFALDFTHFTSPPMGSYAAASTDAHIVGVLRGVGDLSPKPLATKLRELQAANGRLELTTARLQQGDLVANAAGAVSLNPRGALNGEINLTVINFGKLLQVLGVDRMIAQAVPQATIDKLAPGLDRVMPGLGGLLRGNTGAAGGGAAASLGAAAVGGKPTELDGQRAITMLLRLSDGAAYLGPLKVGQLPPLF
jgi:hypothetical protein